MPAKIDRTLNPKKNLLFEKILPKVFPKCSHPPTQTELLTAQTFSQIPKKTLVLRLFLEKLPRCSCGDAVVSFEEIRLFLFD